MSVQQSSKYFIPNDFTMLFRNLILCSLNGSAPVLIDIITGTKKYLPIRLHKYKAVGIMLIDEYSPI